MQLNFNNMGYTSTQRSWQFQQQIKLDPVKYAEMKEKDKLRNREARKKKKAELLNDPTKHFKSREYERI